MDPDGDGDPSDGIDGWRLDVPNEIAIPFWVDWCAHVRSINPDAYITGEIWDRADEWLDGRSFDAVMNYEFSKVVFDWVGARRTRSPSARPTNDWPPSGWPTRRRSPTCCRTSSTATTPIVRSRRSTIPTDRSIRAIANRMIRPTTVASPEDAYRRLELLALIQMTYIGAPMVYYGTEVGMWGGRPEQPQDDGLGRPRNLRGSGCGRDAGTPRAVQGDDPPRNDHVRRGSFETLLADDEQDLLVFRRTYEDETLVIALNAGDEEARFTLPDGAWTPIHGDALPDGVVGPISAGSGSSLDDRPPPEPRSPTRGVLLHLTSLPGPRDRGPRPTVPAVHGLARAQWMGYLAGAPDRPCRQGGFALQQRLELRDRTAAGLARRTSRGRTAAPKRTARSQVAEGMHSHGLRGRKTIQGTALAGGVCALCRAQASSAPAIETSWSTRVTGSNPGAVGRRSTEMEPRRSMHSSSSSWSDSGRPSERRRAGDT